MQSYLSQRNSLIILILSVYFIGCSRSESEHNNSIWQENSKIEKFNPTTNIDAFESIISSDSKSTKNISTLIFSDLQISLFKKKIENLEKKAKIVLLIQDFEILEKLDEKNEKLYLHLDFHAGIYYLRVGSNGLKGGGNDGSKGDCGDKGDRGGSSSNNDRNTSFREAVMEYDRAERGVRGAAERGLREIAARESEIFGRGGDRSNNERGDFTERYTRNPI